MVHGKSTEKEAVVVEEVQQKERRNGMVGPPPVLTADGRQVRIGGEESEEKNERKRRNGMVEAPFVGPDGFVTSAHHQTVQDTRSR